MRRIPSFHEGVTSKVEEKFKKSTNIILQSTIKIEFSFEINITIYSINIC